MSGNKERIASLQLYPITERVIMRYIILLSCIAALLATLSYISDMLLRFHKVATQVYCEHRADFNKCSQEFQEKTSKLMRE